MDVALDENIARGIVAGTMSTAATTDIRARRRRLGVTRLSLAIRTGISTTHLAEIEGGSRPRGTALARVLDELDRLEAAEADGEPSRFEGYDHTMTHCSPDTSGPRAA